jgi:hypothetical protein
LAKRKHKVVITPPRKKLRISIPVNPMGGIESHLVEWVFCAELEAMLNARGWDLERTICRDRPVVSTRNRLIKQFLDTSDADVLMTIDSDQVPQSGAKDMIAGMDRLIDAIALDSVDVVNAITLRGTERGPLPVISKITGPLKGELFTEILQKPRGLHELRTEDNFGVMGGAAIMVKRKVLETFREKEILWFWDVFAEKQGEHFDELSGEDTWGQRLIGHDYWFFNKCHELGFRCWVDTKSFWGHIKPCDLRAEFRREMDSLRSLNEAREAPTKMAEMLRELWGELHDFEGHENWSAPGAFIERMVEEVGKLPDDQMVVECGSGLTSFILTRMLPKDRLIILENNQQWFKEIQPHVNGSLTYAPLEDKGEYEWYRQPDFPREVGLVVCDGPPMGSKGGRSGGLPEMWPHLADKFVFMLDDAHRAHERRVLDDWKAEFKVGASYYDRFAVIEHWKK